MKKISYLKLAGHVLSIFLPLCFATLPAWAATKDGDYHWLKEPLIALGLFFSPAILWYILRLIFRIIDHHKHDDHNPPGGSSGSRGDTDTDYNSDFNNDDYGGNDYGSGGGDDYGGGGDSGGGGSEGGW